MTTPRRVLVIPVAVALLLALAATGWAAPTVGPLNADPATVEVNTQTPVLVTAVITDPAYIAGSAFLQRVSSSGTITTLGVLRDDGANGDAAAGDGLFSLRATFNEPQTGTIRLRVSAAFRGFVRRVVSEELSIPVGVVVPPNFGVTVAGPAGTSITVAPNSIDLEVVVGIAPVATAVIVAPTANLTTVAAVQVVFDPTDLNGAQLPPSQPLQISVPAPPNTPSGAEFIVAQQVFADSTDGVSGLRRQLIATASAGLDGTNIVTQGSVLPGILQAGTYAIVTATGSGFVTGIVTDASGPAGGVVVSNDTNPLIAISDETGRYSLFISGGPFTLAALHPLRGSRGTASGTIAVPGSTVNVDIVLAPLDTPPVTRDGVRNGGFERCAQPAADAVGNLTGSWAFTGPARAIQQFGPTSTGVVITPTEGKCMAEISTGPDAIGAGSTLSQRFVVPAGVRTLTFDFNFVSEEFDEYVGSVFNDVFTATIVTPAGETTIAQVQVNDFFTTEPGGFALIGDCVPGGDDTCGQTGWRSASVDLSAFSSRTQPVTVELVFTVTDRGDNLFDTHVLIDNVRFGTLWVDAKVISGANASLARVDQEILHATEVLSQAGLNVRLRSVQPIADPGGITDIDTTWAPGSNPCPLAGQIDGRLTEEEALSMTLERSDTPTDINIYYVRSSTRPVGGVVQVVRLAGYAIGADEFCNEVEELTNSGGLVMDLAIGRLGVLAHEIGHLILAPEPFSSTLEHGVLSLDPSNFMVGSPTPINGVVNRAQSANINRPAAVLILP